MSKTTGSLIFLAMTIAAVVIAFSFPAIPQPQEYHQFADTKAMFGIPNFANVVGNAPFILFGFMGLRLLLNRPPDDENFSMQGEKVLWGLFFFNAVLVAFGSAYYHLAPDNGTLIWDRLPMAIAFMSFFALVIMARIHAKTGLLLSPLLILTGVVSVVYWYYTETIGRGDLRAYAVVQFLPVIMIPMMLVLFPARYDSARFIAYTIGWYVIAKLLEHYDKEIYQLFNQTVSGHALKHVAASMGVYMLYLYLKKRQRLG